MGWDSRQRRCCVRLLRLKTISWMGDPASRKSHSPPPPLQTSWSPRLNTWAFFTTAFYHLIVTSQWCCNKQEQEQKKEKRNLPEIIFVDWIIRSFKPSLRWVWSAGNWAVLQGQTEGWMLHQPMQDALMLPHVKNRETQSKTPGEPFYMDALFVCLFVSLSVMCEFTHIWSRQCNFLSWTWRNEFCSDVLIDWFYFIFYFWWLGFFSTQWFPLFAIVTPKQASVNAVVGLLAKVHFHLLIVSCWWWESFTGNCYAPCQPGANCIHVF